MQSMVACCPSLDSLVLGRQLPVETVTPLQDLTGLRTLCVCAPFEPFHDSAPSLARLATLQVLVVQSKADQVTVSGLLQLTALQQLRHLQVIGAAFDPGLTPGLRDQGLSFFLEVGPVWFVLSLPWSVGSAAHRSGGDEQKC